MCTQGCQECRTQQHMKSWFSVSARTGAVYVTMHKQRSSFTGLTWFTSWETYFHTCWSVPTSPNPLVLKLGLIPSAGVTVLRRGPSVWRRHFLNEICKSKVAFLQGFLSINPSGRVNWGNFSFWE